MTTGQQRTIRSRGQRGRTAHSIRGDASAGAWPRRARQLGLGTLGAVLLALLLLGSATRALAAPVVIATIPVGANPFGVAVNPTTNRIYVTNARDNTVSVIEDAPTTGPCTSNCGTNATPELGSGELLATGLLPIAALVLYRRRRTHRAQRQ